MRCEAGDETGQESSKRRHVAAPNMAAIDITIHAGFLPHDDREASLASDQPDTSIVLHPPVATPCVTDDERRTVAEMMAKGTYVSSNLATTDLDGTFERLQAGDAEVVQEPTEQPDGLRDWAFRDLAGNLNCIQELRNG